MTADNPSPPWTSDNPFLRGAYAPVFEERDDRNLPVHGEIPRDLSGVFLRNGPNPQFAPEIYQYPMDGTGMVHAIYFEDGQARYRNRWVRTTEFLQERTAGPGHGDRGDPAARRRAGWGPRSNGFGRPDLPNGLGRGRVRLRWGRG